MTTMDEMEDAYQQYESREGYCSHCGAKMMEYANKLNKPMMMALQKIYRNHKQKPILISSVLLHPQICNFSKLKHWGLVTKDETDGYWKITDKGVKFLFNQVVVPLKVWTFRDKVTKFDETLVGINDVDADFQNREYYIEMSNKVRVMEDGKIHFKDKDEIDFLDDLCYDGEK
jgi:hypothetical protein